MNEKTEEQTTDQQMQSLGLKGLWAQVANASAVVVIAVAMFLQMRSTSELHRQSIEAMQSLRAADIQAMKEMRDMERKADDMRHEAIRSTIERNSLVIEELTKAIDEKRM